METKQPIHMSNPGRMISDNQSDEQHIRSYFDLNKTTIYYTNTGSNRLQFHKHILNVSNMARAGRFVSTYGKIFTDEKDYAFHKIFPWKDKVFFAFTEQAKNDKVQF